MILLQRGKLTQALECFQQWLLIGTAMGERRMVSRAMGRLGAVYINLADKACALDCFEQQLQIATKLGDRLSTGNALGNLASICHVELFDYIRAWDYRQQKIQLWSEI